MQRLIIVGIIWGLCLSMLKCGIMLDRKREQDTIVLREISLLRVVTIGQFATLMIYWFNELDTIFGFVVCFLISMFFPYLSRTSKYRAQYSGDRNRHWTDKLIFTSGVYLIGSACAIIYGQYQMGLVCFITFLGSSLYHRYCEMVFFNLDNIFATSLLFVFSYTLMSSAHHNETYFTLGLLGLPVAVFLIVYCGMPADIQLGGGELCCIRTGRPLYDSVHMLWHLASGIGPLLAVWYIDSLQYSGCEGCMESYHFATQTLPSLALVGAAAVNVVGNWFDIMPLD